MKSPWAQIGGLGDAFQLMTRRILSVSAIKYDVPV
jgi:hypothetical protein